MNWPNFFTRCLYRRYEGPLQFLSFLADIKVLRTAHEFRDFELSCEKHIVALASTETGTKLCSSSGPSGPRTRMFWPLSGHSGPRVAVPFVLGPFGPSAPLPPFGWQHCRGRLPAPWYHHISCQSNFRACTYCVNIAWTKLMRISVSYGHKSKTHKRVDSRRRFIDLSKKWWGQLTNNDLEAIGEKLKTRWKAFR